MPSALFVSLGVDSLGAVMFVRSLSESLGLSVDPNKVYAPDVTVGGFARELWQEATRISPHALARLGILSAGDEQDAASEQLSRVQADFENGLLANRRLYEGLRGALAVMVRPDRGMISDHIYPVIGMFSDRVLPRYRDVF